MKARKRASFNKETFQHRAFMRSIRQGIKELEEYHKGHRGITTRTLPSYVTVKTIGELFE